MNSIEKIKSLSIWSHELTINPLEGGITNLNFLVNHGDDKLVVRLG
ncbi:MAG: choline kinase, partial [Betaproteobacteria bacterium]|nr:choline kinase [Betaproteobacteria bacterium]